MSRVERRHEAAHEVAAWLDEQGEPFRAGVVRAVCQSLVAASSALSQLHRDNRDLRAAQRGPKDAPTPSRPSPNPSSET